MQTNNKQREALGKILWCLEWMFNNTDDKSVQSHLVEPIALAKAALAETVKNCEVGTAEEQRKRFNEFCDEHSWDEVDGAHCSLSCPLYHGDGARCDELEWAQMPYEAEKGGAK